MRIAFVAAGLVSLCLGFCACGGKDPYSPGTKLGTFHVTALLSKSSCGATPTPWEFDVKLNHDLRTVYWVQGGAPIAGEMDATSKAQMQAQTSYEVRAADAKKKLAACAVQRLDAVGVVLTDANSNPVSDPESTRKFHGTLVYGFSPTSGSDCSDQLASAGGDFPALPCDVQYEITAELSAPPTAH